MSSQRAGRDVRVAGVMMVVVAQLVGCSVTFAVSVSVHVHYIAVRYGRLGVAERAMVWKFDNFVGCVNQHVDALERSCEADLRIKVLVRPSTSVGRMCCAAIL